MRNKTLITSIITTSLCLFFLTPSSAGVYKWVDQDGQIHYGDQPVNPDAEKVNIRKNDTTKPRAIKNKEDNSEDKSNKQTATEPKEVEIPQKEKNRLCNEAKSDIASITSRGRMREKNAKGEYSYLSEKQRQQRLTAAKKKQREFCR
ncbi:MAG: DUF4124 domain-containing protein [Gammaproteobacteria bacterium]|nr:DUF4124 domain-containing protein [Gammaproteobacteria bacterium]